MSYKALYRNYRPQTFDEVIDQEYVVKTLKNAILYDKISHAYLFCGPRGTGKTSIAKILAKSLNCIHGPTVSPCGVCQICQGIKNGNIPDVIELDAASNNGADDIRQIRDSTRYLPTVCKYKVYIIDEVHMLSTQAFNALLKILEEPPHYVVFILATTEDYKIPQTILSRVQRFDFKQISDEGINKRLLHVLKNEGFEIDDEALNKVIELSSGGLRDALSILDQTISYIDNNQIKLDDILNICGLVSSSSLYELFKALYKKEFENSMLIIEKIVNEGKDLSKLVSDLLIFLKNILLYLSNIDPKISILYSEDFSTFSKTLNKNIILNIINILNECNNNIKFSLNKRSYLDIAVIKITKTEDDISIVEYLKSEIYKLNNIVSDLQKNQNNTFIQRQICTKEEIDKLKEETNNTNTSTNNISMSSNNITVSDILQILNNGIKTKKDIVSNHLQQIKQKHNQDFTVEILTNSLVVAASKNEILFVQTDIDFCTRIMKQENYVKLLETLQKYDTCLESFIVIPQNIWKQILKDYKEKMKLNQSNFELDYINIPIKKPVINDIIKKENNLNIDTLDVLEKTFGKKLEVEE